MSDLIQCAACGYITDAWATVCARCERPLGAGSEAPQPGPRAPDVPYAAPVETPFGAPVGPSPFAAPVRPPARRRNPVALAGLALTLVAAGCLVAFYIHFVKPETERQSKADDLKALFARQPDFLADCEGVEGDFRYKATVARKGARFLLEFDVARSLLVGDPSRSGKTPVSAIIGSGANVQIVVPELQAVIEIPRNSKDMPKDDPMQSLLKIVGEKNCEVREFGKSSVGSYETRLFCISDTESVRRDAYVEVAPALQNLVVAVDFNDDWTQFDGPLKYTLSNVRLDVDDALFRVPGYYAKIAR